MKLFLKNNSLSFGFPPCSAPFEDMFLNVDQANTRFAGDYTLDCNGTALADDVSDFPTWMINGTALNSAFRGIGISI